MVDAGFLEEFPLGGDQGLFAWVNSALGHLPSIACLTTAFTDENEAIMIDERDAGTGAVSRRGRVSSRIGQGSMPDCRQR